MASYRLTISTSNDSSTVEGDSTPATSADGKDRVVWSCDNFGRGVSVTVQPLTADAQFVLHSVEVIVIPSMAGPEDA